MQQSNIDIQDKLCVACGFCVDVCPAAVIALKDNKAVGIHPNRCIACGHCAAICPEDAISGTSSQKPFRFVTRLVPEDYSPVERLLASKRSIRRFTSQSLSPEMIKKLLYFAEKAPSSRNSRTRSYCILSDEKSIRDAENAVMADFRRVRRLMNPLVIRLITLFHPGKRKQYLALRRLLGTLIYRFEQGGSPVFRHAPCVVVGIAAKKGMQAKDDALAAQHYMMLHAHSLGIGSCIIGYAQFASKGLSKLLAISRKQSVYAVTALGYPVYAYKKEIIYPLPELAFIRT